MTAIVRIALRRPYTFVVLALLLLIIGPLAASRTPVDIFPEIRNPDHRGGLEFHRAAAGGDGRPHGLAVRAGAHHHGQRHRAYRGQLLHRRRHRQDFLPPRYRHAHRERAGDRDLADHAAADAPRLRAAAYSQLQCGDRPDHPAGARRQGTARADAVRSRAQLRAHPAEHGAGRGDALAVRRQVSSGPDRHRPGGDAGARPFRPGRRQRAGRAEPDHPGRHAEDRNLRICDQPEQRALGDQDARRPADQARQRRHGLRPRRGSRARRQSAADQHRSCRRQPLRAHGQC